MKIQSLVIVAVISLVSSGCNSVKKPVVVTLPLPPLISQENVLTQNDLECLTDAALDKVILLDKRRKTLREIIQSSRK